VFSEPGICTSATTITPSSEEQMSTLTLTHEPAPANLLPRPIRGLTVHDLDENVLKQLSWEAWARIRLRIEEERIRAAAATQWLCLNLRLDPALEQLEEDLSESLALMLFPHLSPL
jgi:hypothetical protein